MDGLSIKLTEGSKAALQLVKTTITTPTLINTDVRQGPLYAIALAAESYQKSCSAEVSESLVITQDTKKTIADNVAPGSKSWSMSGYIPGNKALEPTNYFTPLVRLNTDILWSWFESGAVLIFKDSNAQIYEHVVIKELTTSEQKDCANAVPFSMTLKEINVMDTSLLGMLNEGATKISKLIKSVAAVGSVVGTAAIVGSTTASKEEDEEEKSA